MRLKTLAWLVIALGCRPAASTSQMLADAPTSTVKISIVQEASSLRFKLVEANAAHVQYVLEVTPDDSSASGVIKEPTSKWQDAVPASGLLYKVRVALTDGRVCVPAKAIALTGTHSFDCRVDDSQPVSYYYQAAKITADNTCNTANFGKIFATDSDLKGGWSVCSKSKSGSYFTYKLLPSSTATKLKSVTYFELAFNGQKYGGALFEPTVRSDETDILLCPLNVENMSCEQQKIKLNFDKDTSSLEVKFSSKELPKLTLVELGYGVLVNFTDDKSSGLSLPLTLNF